MGHESRRLVLQVLGEVRRGWALSVFPPRLMHVLLHEVGLEVHKSCSYKRTLDILARGVIGNTPGFDPGIPSSSLGGPVPPEVQATSKQED